MYNPQAVKRKRCRRTNNFLRIAHGNLVDKTDFLYLMLSLIEECCQNIYSQSTAENYLNHVAEITFALEEFKKTIT